MDPMKVDQVFICDKCGVQLKVIKACDSICPCCQPTCCGIPLRLKEDKK